MPTVLLIYSATFIPQLEFQRPLMVSHFLPDKTRIEGHSNDPCLLVFLDSVEIKISLRLFNSRRVGPSCHGS